jgi:hypothetical protein|nr:MAG TPA: hypothetical protein [Caudoviricetes sp.]
MTVQDLFRILLDSEEVILNTSYVQWSGLAKDIPCRFFDYLIDTIYSVGDSGESCIIINLK